MQRERSLTAAAYWSGFRAGMPFILVVVPFALLFGLVATEAGLDLLQTMTMAILVIAGAAQITALALMAEQAPVIIVLATSLAVNLRMAMYSAALAPHLGKAGSWTKLLMAYLLVDQNFAIASLKFEESPEMSTSEKVAFYFGAVSPVAPLWYIATFVGALLGSAIPPEFSLDFAIPICFIALTGPMLRTPAHVVAALVSIVGALALVWVPYSMGLLIAAVLAMMAGAQAELWLKGRSG